MTRPDFRRRPHEHIQFCPLYVALHGATTAEFGCGPTDETTCAVERGGSYEHRLKRLRDAWPGFVFGIEDTERERAARDQRRSNMRAAGVN